jgi:hypothetical protein
MKKIYVQNNKNVKNAIDLKQKYINAMADGVSTAKQWLR